MKFNIGLIKTSLKENEKRLSIFPEHLSRYSEGLRKRMVFEENYGIEYGIKNEDIIHQGAKMSSRDEIFRKCKLIVLPKPVKEDVTRMKEKQVLFGWAHCVQNKDITQAAIENKVTVIAWESMNYWSPFGKKLLHIFHKNNEIAGYSAILHVLQLLGIDGHYGPRQKIVVLSYGSVSRGAICALQGRGFNNIHVFTKRKPHLVADQNPDVYFGHYYINKNNNIMALDSEGNRKPLIDYLAEADIICNGILQDPKNPIMFINKSDMKIIKDNVIIIDISCDEGMSFYFAKPTTFSEPIKKIERNITYYAVDHTPSYLWRASTREISKALLPYLEIVSGGKKEWENNMTIQRAIEISEGIVLNKTIIEYQRRNRKYPHHYIY